jgi:pimeloyl-ACP methyl ester carboxylesterase
MQQAVPPPRFATARLATGLRVHYAEQGDPGGQPILFLPAYADSWFSYSRVLPLLSARYHVFVLDQRAMATPNDPAAAMASMTSPPTRWRSWTPSASSAWPWSATRGVPSRPGG